MAKIIVTGSHGFVGQYLVKLLKSSSKDKIYGLDRDEADITDYKSVKKYLDKIKPNQIYHLAGFASGAGKDKKLIFKVNVDGTINILKALKELKKPVKVLLASTAYIYGNTNSCASEKTKTDAKSFYDQSKLEMEKVAKKYQNACLKANIDIVITRATNHTGPGQKPGFAVPDFCQQIVSAKSGAFRHASILVGNLDAKRDLFDVRDCVKAYRLVMKKGVSGEIYNIGPGKPVTMKEVLQKLIKISGKKISYSIDHEKKRPSDIRKNCVNSSKIKKLGWQPKIKLDKTLKDCYKYFLECHRAFRHLEA